MPRNTEESESRYADARAGRNGVGGGPRCKKTRVAVRGPLSKVRLGFLRRQFSRNRRRTTSGKVATAARPNGPAREPPALPLEAPNPPAASASASAQSPTSGRRFL